MTPLDILAWCGASVCVIVTAMFGYFAAIQVIDRVRDRLQERRKYRNRRKIERTLAARRTSRN